MTDDAPGWKPDPSGTHDHRYWDGSQWTEHVSDAGVAAVDPYVAPAPEAPTESLPTAATGDAPPPVPGEPDATIVGATGAGSDPTSTWPAAPGAPAPPPPYVPPTPASDGGSGGSKRGLLIGAGILAAVVAAVIAIMALGGDDDPSVRAQLASKLRAEEDSLSGSQAECVADLIVDEAGEDAFADTDWDADDPPPEFISALLSVGLTTLAEECDISESAFGGDTDGGDSSTTDGSGDGGSYGSDPELDALYDDCQAGDYQACDDLFFQSPTDSEYERFGDTCGERNEPSGTCVSLYGGGDDDGGGFTDAGALPDNFEDIIADTYVTSLGLDRDKAECLADKIGEAIREGLLDQEDAFTEVFDYLEECDISMEELSGG